jgi:hypothetical protein
MSKISEISSEKNTTLIVELEHMGEDGNVTLLKPLDIGSGK